MDRRHGADDPSLVRTGEGYNPYWLSCDAGALDAVWTPLAWTEAPAAG
jgi:hypothetical protein